MNRAHVLAVTLASCSCLICGCSQSPERTAQAALQAPPHETPQAATTPSPAPATSAPELSAAEELETYRGTIKEAFWTKTTSFMESSGGDFVLVLSVLSPAPRGSDKQITLLPTESVPKERLQSLVERRVSMQVRFVKYVHEYEDQGGQQPEGLEKRPMLDAFGKPMHDDYGNPRMIIVQQRSGYQVERVEELGG